MNTIRVHITTAPNEAVITKQALGAPEFVRLLRHAFTDVRVQLC
jgi:hypothetical protein